MSRLFELSAALSLDTSAFIRSVRQAESTAKALQSDVESRMSAASAAMQSLQGSAASTWRSVTASIQSAIDKTREYMALGGMQTASAQGFATGMDYVPSNNFPALLHEGEAVLTRLEAAQWRKGETVQTIDPTALASAVASALSGVTVEMDSQAIGRLVAPTVDQALSRTARTRRYA